MVKEFADKQRDRSQVFSLPNLVPPARAPSPAVSLAPSRSRPVARRQLSQSVQTPPRGAVFTRSSTQRHPIHCRHTSCDVVTTSRHAPSRQRSMRCYQDNQGVVRCHQDNGGLARSLEIVHAAAYIAITHIHACICTYFMHIY